MIFHLPLPHLRPTKLLFLLVIAVALSGVMARAQAAWPYQRVEVNPGEVVQLGQTKFVRLSENGLHLALDNVFLCPPGSYIQDDSCSACLDQLDHCLACTSATRCYVCETGYHLENYQCVPNCDQVSNCQTCAAPQYCDASGCQTGYYFDAGSCSSCSAVMPQCTACTSGTNCTACNSGYYSAGASCETCASALPHCATCTDASTCQTCETGYHLQAGACVPDCNVAYCNTCSVPNYCGDTPDSCVTGYYSQGGSCLSCASALTGCQACASDTACTACRAGYLLENGNCIPTGNISDCTVYSDPDVCSTCAGGYFLDTNACLACTDPIAQCASCSGTLATSVTCANCNPGYHLDNNTCVMNCDVDHCQSCASPDYCGSTSCEVGFWETGGTCASCSATLANCTACSDGATCTTCAEGYHLEGGVCLPDCEVTNCTSAYSCSAPHFCTSCVTGYTPNPTTGKCDMNCNVPNCFNTSSCSSPDWCATCATGYYPNPINGACNSCTSIHNQCTACIDNSTCTACAPGYKVKDDSCWEMCTISNCATCEEDDNTVCLVCKPDHVLINNECIHINETMQGWSGCDGLALPAPGGYTPGPVLVDTRDAKEYEVRKFADGKCWMADNLAYGGDGEDLCAGNTSYMGIIMSIYQPWGYGECRDPSAGGTPTCPAGSYDCGYLYNYQGVVQHQYAYFNQPTQPSEPTQGFCPSGWHVPSGGPSGEFANLDAANGGDGSNRANCTTPECEFFRPGGGFKSVYAGQCSFGGQLTKQGISSHYGTSTSANPSSSYGMEVNPTDVLPRQSAYNKSIGHSVRCIKSSMSCSSNCVTCTSATDCTTCRIGYYLNGGTCSSCADAMPGCTHCSSGATCDSCSAGYLLMAGGVCIPTGNISNCTNYSAPDVCATCEDGYYLGANRCNSCMAALPGCTACSAGNACTTCEDGYDLIAGHCVPTGDVEQCSAYSFPDICATCDQGYYLHTNACPACGDVLADCLACNSATNCTSCDEGTILQTGTCHTCAAAVSDCTTCDGTACTSCASEHYLDSGACPLCSSAITGCSECSNGQTCTQCSAGYILENDACTPTGDVPNCTNYSVPDVCATCDTGYTLDLDTNTCVMDCNVDSCHTCTAPNYCGPTGCNEGYFSELGSCSACSSALPGCTACSSGSTCTTCAPGYVLYQDTCLAIPDAPANLDLPAEIFNGLEFNLNWDPVASATGYLMDRSCGGESFDTIYQGATPSASNSMVGCDEPVQYRVKAYNGVVTIASAYYTTPARSFTPCAPNCARCTAADVCLSCNADSVLIGQVCYKSMQQYQASECASVATPAAGSYTAIEQMLDERDGKLYEIRKFSDGNCWMVDNLAYGGGTDGDGDYCVGKSTFRSASSYAQIQPVATSGLNPTDGSANQLVGDCLDPSAIGCVVGTNGAVSCPCAAAGNKCGYFYNYAAAIQNPNIWAGKNVVLSIDPLQGICPAGWHVLHGNDLLAVVEGLSATGTDFSDQALLNSYSGSYQVNSGSAYQGAESRYWKTDAGSASGNNSIMVEQTMMGYMSMPVENGATVRCIKNGADCTVANCAVCDGGTGTCTTCATGYGLVGDTCQVTPATPGSITIPAPLYNAQDIPVTWEVVTGATGYLLERSCDGNSWTAVYDGLATTITDPASGCATQIVYRVRAYSGATTNASAPRESDVVTFEACSDTLSSCTTCTNGNTCTTCESGHTLSGGQCVMSCNVSNCDSCSSPDYCSSCASGYYPSGGGCYMSCSVAGCNSCSSPDYCESCESGYTLSGGSCVPDCDVSECRTCSSPNYCTDCRSGYYDYGGSCYLECYVSGCAECDYANHCIRCSSGYTYSNGSCLDDCNGKQHCTEDSDCDGGVCESGCCETE